MEWSKEEQKAHRKIWVDALRSGKYNQTTGYLQDARGFCCLGVACDISGLGEWTETLNCMGKPIKAYNNFKADLPQIVTTWLGLKDSFGQYSATSLSTDNDTGKSFLEIADTIESEPKGLVVE